MYWSYSEVAEGRNMLLRHPYTFIQAIPFHVYNKQDASDFNFKASVHPNLRQGNLRDERQDQDWTGIKDNSSAACRT